MKKIIFGFTLATFVILSCSESITEPTSVTLSAPVLPQTPFDYANLALPSGSQPANNIIDFFDNFGNPGFSTSITDDGATLGRVLFYDKNLSLNNTIACGSCHHQDKAFADGKQFSEGFEGRVTTRNSMAIVNPIVQNNLFWDSRSKSLTELSLKPVQNHIEMGMENIDKLAERISNIEYYSPLFSKAFGNSEVTSDKIADALTQFVGSITSNRSRFDIATTKPSLEGLTDLEKLGNQIFNSDRAKCASCHGGGAMAAQDGPNDPYGSGGGSSNSNRVDLQGATNIGLDIVYKDNGVSNGRFKIPTLRNVELTGPYMHDGRFATLEDVVNHYSSGIKPHKDLDPKFKDAHGNVVQMNFTGVEKKAIVAFLNTLTDTEMTSNPKWSNPFKR